MTAPVVMDEDALVGWGEAVGRSVRPPAVITLHGDLGAGKTTLARAIARGAGVGGHIPSPTYNLQFRYDADGGRSVVHIDLYRLERPDEVWALGWAELPASDEVVLIEWPERAAQLLPEPRWEVAIEEGETQGVRLISLRPIGDPAPIVQPPDRMKRRSER